MSDCLRPSDFERYAAGLLEESPAAKVRAHIEACEACRAAYERFQRDQSFLNKVKPLDIDATASLVAGKSPDSSPSAKAAGQFPGIEGYRITGVLGQGGMGIVYRAVQTKLNRAVALKVLPAMVGAASPSAVKRFRQEAAAAASLHHTHIIPIYDYGESSDAYFYTMELITGSPLNVVIRRLAEEKASTASPARLATILQAHAGTEPRAPAQADTREPSSDASGPGSSSTGRGRVYYQQVARWMADAADALYYAHSHGIIHRDVKPSNLILSVDGRILIGDFGLAKCADEESVTITGSLVGTIRYLSPEQAMAKRISVDHRTDIYSLGATMYELLCFTAAFPGADDKQVLAAIITREPLSPRKIVPTVPAELETICLRCMEKDREARFPTARALAEELRRYMHDLPLETKRPGPIERTWKFIRRHKPAVTAAAAILLLVVAVPALINIARTEGKRRVAAQWIAKAQQRERGQRWLQAAAMYEKALGVHAESVEALGNFARMKKEQYNQQLARDGKGDQTLLEQAVELSARALAIEPDDSNLWNTQGVLLKKLERYDESIVAYRRALELDEDNNAAWENLGIAHALNEDLQAARKNIQHAAELCGTTEPQCVYPWRNLAAVELHLGDPAAAKHIQNALACNHKDAAAWRLEARLLLESGESGASAEALEAAHRADFLAGALDPCAKRMCALVHLRLEQWEEAVADAHAAVGRHDAFDAADYFIIATAQARLGRLENARKAYDAGLASYPPKLRRPGSYSVSADAGVLWFESSGTLRHLQDEAARLLSAP